MFPQFTMSKEELHLGNLAIAVAFIQQKAPVINQGFDNLREQ